MMRCLLDKYHLSVNRQHVKHRLFHKIVQCVAKVDKQKNVDVTFIDGGVIAPDLVAVMATDITRQHETRHRDFAGEDWATLKSVYLTVYGMMLDDTETQGNMDSRWNKIRLTYFHRKNYYQVHYQWDEDFAWLWGLSPNDPRFCQVDVHSHMAIRSWEGLPEDHPRPWRHAMLQDSSCFGGAMFNPYTGLSEHNQRDLNHLAYVMRSQTGKPHVLRDDMDSVVTLVKSAIASRNHMIRHALSVFYNNLKSDSIKLLKDAGIDFTPMLHKRRDPGLS